MDRDGPGREIRKCDGPGRVGPQLIVSKFDARGRAGANESCDGCCRVQFFLGGILSREGSCLDMVPLTNTADGILLLLLL